MRGTVARRIRKDVYGDFSTREKGYKAKVFGKLMELFRAGQRKVIPITITTSGLRPKYQAAKRAYMRGAIA